MSTKDKRVDKYITKAKPFAKPILKHIREVVHKASPDIEETAKWGFPHFDYKGEMLCSMAGFKDHCVFMFWKHSLMKDVSKILGARKAKDGLTWITALDDLPADDILIAYVKQAIKLNEEGIKLPQKPKKVTDKKDLVVPLYLKRELNKNKKAKEVFDAFSYSNQKEYIVWLTDAKLPATRKERLKIAIEWIAEGKVRNWKYLK
jgi:uncharacterized protein YdeI (YjbR/CyaY-like superfamily)